MDRLNVLSIDFDYFQEIPRDTLPAFPDGIDLPLQLSNLVWASRYMCYAEQFQKVLFDKENFSLLKEILAKQSSNTPVIIASSHKEAYKFIHYINGNRKDGRVSLTNVDLHHDLDNGNKELDCGNWIGFLLKEHLLYNFTWVTKPLSQQVYGLSDDDMNGFHAHFDLSKISNTKFDAIFICKSNPWVLPDFDPYFTELVELCKKHFQTPDIESEIKKIRILPKIQMETPKRVRKEK